MPERGEKPGINNLEIERSLNGVVTAVNVESLMPPNWQQQISEVVKNHGRFVQFKGRAVSTSLEDEGFTTGYTVVKGPDIKANLPWLWKLYGIRRQPIHRLSKDDALRMGKAQVCIPERRNFVKYFE
jgi:hypothetical protein